MDKIDKKSLKEFKERMRIQIIKRTNEIYGRKSLDELIENKKWFENNIIKLENMDKSEYYTLLNHSHYYDFKMEWFDYTTTPKQMFDRVLSNNYKSLKEITNYLTLGTVEKI